MKNKASLENDADHVLQNIRIVLPGTQALLGFQFIAFFNPTFQALSNHLKYLHFSALILIIICTFLLVAPVAFQQIGEEGKVSHKFLSFTRTMIAVAMLILLLAITADIYLAARMINLEVKLAAIISGLSLITGIFLWYVYSIIRRFSLND
jgi:hypothetical protein